MMTSKLPSLIGITLILKGWFYKIKGQPWITGASFTQGTVSTIPFLGGISPEGFLPPILLLVVIIATVVVTVVVVVFVGGVPSVLKLLFMVIGFCLSFRAVATIVRQQFPMAHESWLMLQMLRTGLLPTGHELFPRIHACFRDELDNVVEEEDGGWICFLGGNNSLGTKKYRGSNSSDGGDTGDGVKIVGEVIGSGGGVGDSTGVSVSLGGGILIVPDSHRKYI
ncbi:hypothetical protein Tco_1270170 [Tanacetum coccineum]